MEIFVIIVLQRLYNIIPPLKINNMIGLDSVKRTYLKIIYYVRNQISIIFLQLLRGLLVLKNKLSKIYAEILVRLNFKK